MNSIATRQQDLAGARTKYRLEGNRHTGLGGREVAIRKNTMEDSPPYGGHYARTSVVSIITSVMAVPKEYFLS